MMRKIKSLIFVSLIFSLTSCLDDIELAINDVASPTAAEKVNKETDLTSEEAIENLDLPRLLKESCVTVEGKCSGGSGAFVQNDLVVTNHHVIWNKRKGKVCLGITVRNYKGETSSAEVVKYDPHNDLAILKLNNKIANKSLKINTNLPKVTDDIWLSGSPRALDENNELTTFCCNIQPGKITKIHNDLDKLVMIHNADVTYGNSGGPVVNLSGHLIGVVSSRNMGTSLNFAVPAKYIKSMLEDVKF